MINGVVSSAECDKPDRRAERAQQAFDRAMTGAGGVAGVGAPTMTQRKSLPNWKR